MLLSVNNWMIPPAAPVMTSLPMLKQFEDECELITDDPLVGIYNVMDRQTSPSLGILIFLLPVCVWVSLQ